MYTKTNYKTILESHAPVRWLSFNIKRLMQNRDFDKKQSVKHGCHWRLYQPFRNRLNTKIRKNNAECNINHRKNTWKLINPLMGMVITYQNL